MKNILMLIFILLLISCKTSKKYEFNYGEFKGSLLYTLKFITKKDTVNIAEFVVYNDSIKRIYGKHIYGNNDRGKIFYTYSSINYYEDSVKFIENVNLRNDIFIEIVNFYVYNNENEKLNYLSSSYEIKNDSLIDLKNTSIYFEDNQTNKQYKIFP